MKTLSLSELKAQNASENDTIEEVIEDVEELEHDDKLEVEEDSTEETKESKESDESEEGEAKAEDLEDWEKSETKDDGKGKFVPNAEAKKLRLKTKDLKAEGREKDLELEQLRSQVETLSNPQAVIAEKPRPKLEDFDYDEDRHVQALDSWYDSRFDARMDSHTSKLQQQREQTTQVNALNQQKELAVNKHLNSAAELINSGKITEDNWLAGDRLIRQTLELAIPNSGDQIADQFIALMESNGKGSEKAWYYLGRNPAALTELRDKIVSDSTGSTALMYLAGIQRKANAPIRKKRTDAPSPAPNLKGDISTGTAKSMKKDYEKAGKSGDISSRVKLKRLAKKAGHDVSDW